MSGDPIWSIVRSFSDLDSKKQWLEPYKTRENDVNVLEIISNFSSLTADGMKKLASFGMNKVFSLYSEATGIQQKLLPSTADPGLLIQQACLIDLYYKSRSNQSATEVMREIHSGLIK